MAVQQVVGFSLNPGGREAMLSALGQAKAASEAAGGSVRVASVMSGQLTSAIAVTTEFESWEALAKYTEDTAENLPTQIVRDAIASANPPATLIGRFQRNELVPRDGGSSEGAFHSNLSFDATSNRPAVIAAVGETRDVFEELGASSRVWGTASGENVGRLTIASAFDGEASYYRFRAALEERAAGGTALPMASVAGDSQAAGILHTQAIDV